MLENEQVKGLQNKIDELTSLVKMAIPQEALQIYNKFRMEEEKFIKECRKAEKEN